MQARDAPDVARLLQALSRYLEHRIMIIEDSSEKIDSFEEFLSKKLERIGAINGDDSFLFKKLLYMSFLDSLSACVYPHRANRDRFISTVERFSNWEHQDRVSLPHLGRLVMLSSDPELEKIRGYVVSRLKGWKNRVGERISVTDDPKFSEIEGAGWSGKKALGQSISLSDFKHSHLLYQFRNGLVHQFQSRADEWGSGIPEHPYYQVVIGMDDDWNASPVSVELIYPASCLEKIARETLKNVAIYLKEGNINPFPHYYAGDYWIEALNR